jgi:Mg-chelatase subunit ChlD
MPTLLYPEFLLLAIPLLAWWWLWTKDTAGDDWRQRFSNPRSIFRLVLVLLGVLILAGPALVRGEEGADLIVVVDRSASMTDAARLSSRELLNLAEDQRGPRDRVGIVTFGGRAALERGPDEDARFETFSREVDPNASDLRSALALALESIPRDRPARLLVLSDGAFTGGDPRHFAAQAAARGIPIDVRRLDERPITGDVAVGDFSLPLELQPGEAFRFGVEVFASAATEARWELSRGGEVIARGDEALRTGRNRLSFRDRLWAPGVTRYELRVFAGADRIPENDRGRGVTRVSGDSGVLIFSPEGREGNLARALRAAGRQVTLADDAMRPLDFGTLASFRAIVLENVSIAEFRESELAALERFVVDAGGGLLVTGGRRSFALGGYRKSRLESLLPVSMELEEEQRKSAVGIAFVLDRSGSMAAAVSGGMSKMDLANLGTAASIELLSRSDELSVIAVDSIPHIAVPMSPLENRGKVLAKVRSIEAGGGGIFTYTALVAAADQLNRSDRSIRHIVLFADAADAEEPGDYRSFVPKLVQAGIRVSVIALGSERDPDAGFLKDLAKIGEGSIHFAIDPEALPRLFSMETMNILRSGFIEAATPLLTSPELLTLGELDFEPPPVLGGYSLLRLRPGATAGLITDDEYRAPAFAFWQRGAGRVASFAGEADGQFSGPLSQWEHYDRFFASTLGWLSGREQPAAAMARARRRGREVEVRLELDPDRPEEHPTFAPQLVSVPDDPSQPIVRRPFSWESDTELIARYRLEDGEVRHHRIDLGEDSIRLNPVALPYSPEFELREDRPEGAATLRSLSERSGGRERVELSGLFDHVGEARRFRSLTIPLTALFLFLVVLEIAARRLGLAGDWLRDWQSRRRKPELADPLPRASTAAESSPSASEANSQRKSSADLDAQDAIEAAGRGSAIDSLAEAKRRARR